MKIEVDIEDGKLQNLSPTAKVEIIKVAKIYVEDVLDEASRIEESRRVSTASAEITGAIVNDAVVLAKRFGISTKKRKHSARNQIIAYIATVFTGGLFQIDKFTNVWIIIPFLLAFSISIISTVSIYMNPGKND